MPGYYQQYRGDHATIAESRPSRADAEWRCRLRQNRQDQAEAADSASRQHTLRCFRWLPKQAPVFLQNRDARMGSGRRGKLLRAGRWSAYHPVEQTSCLSHPKQQDTFSRSAPCVHYATQGAPGNSSICQNPPKKHHGGFPKPWHLWLRILFARESISPG